MLRLSLIACGFVVLSSLAQAAPGRLAVGEFHACAIAKDATVKCWGLGEQGQLGDGKMVTSATPVAVAGLKDVDSLSAGYHWTCARHKDGKVSCWGYTDGRWASAADKKNLVKCWEQPGHKKKFPGFDCVSKPMVVPGVTAKSLKLYSDTACVMKKDDAVTCLARTKENSKKQSMDYPELKGATEVSAQAIEYSTGKGHGCALVKGKVVCWGHSVNDILKLKDFGPVPGFTDVTSMALSVRKGAVFGVRKNGDVVFVGGGMEPDNAPKSLKGTSNSVGSDKTVTLAELKGASVIAEGPFHTCGLFGSDVRCWGLNGGQGKLGQGKKDGGSRTPIATSIKNAVELGVGYDHTCAALKTGKVMCWGDNTNGKLGGGAKGKFADKPVEVVGLVVKS